MLLEELTDTDSLIEDNCSDVMVPIYILLRNWPGMWLCRIFIHHPEHIPILSLQHTNNTLNITFMNLFMNLILLEL